MAAAEAGPEGRTAAINTPCMDFPAPNFQTLDTMTLRRAPKLDFWMPVSLTFTGDEIQPLINKK